MDKSSNNKSQIGSIGVEVLTMFNPDIQTDRDLVESMRDAAIRMVHAADVWLGRKPTIPTRKERRKR